MASQSKTQDFFIGDLDLRLSFDLTKAGELSPAETVGLMTQCTVSMVTNEVKLNAGFPQRTYANAVASRDLTITGNLSEYTASNLAMLYGDKEAYLESLSATEAETTLSADVLAAATTLAVVDSSDFAVGDVVYIVSADDSNDVYVANVSSLPDATSIEISYGLPRGFVSGSRVVKGQAIELGSADTVPPMTLQVLGIMPLDGEPFIYDIWKGTISGTVEVATSTDAFGSLAYTISPLTPSIKEIECGVFGDDAAKKAVVKHFKQGRLLKSLSGTTC